MTLDRLTRNLRVLLRANGILAEIQLRALLTRTSLQLLAGLVACFGLLMLDIALFFALVDLWGRTYAAAAIGGANLALALVLVLFASRVQPGRELDLAREVHDTALQAVLDDAKQAQSEATTLLRNPFDGAMSGIIAHLVGALVKHLKS